MRYLGGKFRTAKQIAYQINSLLQSGQAYWEPFVGAGWVLSRVTCNKRYASDANHKLIALWQALQSGWVPPDLVSMEDYYTAMRGGYDDALTAFIGFGCSFSGKWFAGYASDGTGRNYARNARNSLILKIDTMKDVVFFGADFFTIDPPESNCLIYCDPPYFGTTGYGAVPNFDSVAFWDKVLHLKQLGHTLVVSEYRAPDGFRCLASFDTKTDMHTKNGKEARVEKLFI